MPNTFFVAGVSFLRVCSIDTTTKTTSLLQAQRIGSCCTWRIQFHWLWLHHSLLKSKFKPLEVVKKDKNRELIQFFKDFTTKEQPDESKAEKIICLL